MAIKNKTDATIKPCLATDIDFNKLNFPYLGLAKIDGVRAVSILNKGFYSRSMKSFSNKLVTSRYDLPEFQGFDGELSYGSITAKDLVSSTTSVVNSHSDVRANELVWNLFDYITPETIKLPYKERYGLLVKKVREIKETNPELGKRIDIIPAKLILNLTELEAFDKINLDAGYEGSIYRSPEGIYKFGRTTVNENSYLRLKRFIQEDAVVLSIVEALENTNEKVTNELGLSERSSHKANKIPKAMVGSLSCKDIKTGAIITVGPGEMTHEQRIYYFNNQHELIDQVISYKHFPKGAKDSPRFPTFVNIRNKTDLVDE